MRGTESKERDEVEQLLGSARLPKESPAAIFGNLSAGWIALKKNERPHPRLSRENPIDHHVAGTHKGVDRAPR